MAYEVDPKEIKRLPLHPVRPGVKLGGREDIRLSDGRKDLEPETDIICEIVQVIDNRQLAARLIGIMYCCQVGQKLEVQLLVVEKELHHFQIQILWSFKGQQTIRLFEPRKLLSKFSDQSLFNRFVG